MLQRLHFLRKLIPNLTIYKLKERVDDSTRSFRYWGMGLPPTSGEWVLGIGLPPTSGEWGLGS